MLISSQPAKRCRTQWQSAVLSQRQIPRVETDDPLRKRTRERPEGASVELQTGSFARAAVQRGDTDDMLSAA